jgi:hypothetical protein
MAVVLQDLRYAIRRMKDTPAFTAAAILTLALGLGVNSAVLSLAHALFLKPLPLPEASQLVLVDQTLPSRPPIYAFPLSYPDYLYYRDHAHTFEGLAAHYATSPMHVSLGEGGFSVAIGVTERFRVPQVQGAWCGFRVPGAGCRVRVQGSRCRVPGSGSGFHVPGSVQGSRARFERHVEPKWTVNRTWNVEPGTRTWHPAPGTLNPHQAPCTWNPEPAPGTLHLEP